jgi:hypothetical protein
MDAAEVIEGKIIKEEQNIITRIETGKVLVRMLTGFGWTTPSGVHFTNTAPFQVCNWFEAESLISNNPERFEEGTPEDLKNFYGV